MGRVYVLKGQDPRCGWRFYVGFSTCVRARLKTHAQKVACGKRCWLGSCPVASLKLAYVTEAYEWKSNRT